MLSKKRVREFFFTKGGGVYIVSQDSKPQIHANPCGSHRYLFPLAYAAQATPVVFSRFAERHPVGNRGRPMSSVRMGKAFEAVNRCIDSLVDQKDVDQVGGVFYASRSTNLGHFGDSLKILCGIYSIFLEFLVH